MVKEKKTETAISCIKPADFPALAGGGNALETIRFNMGGEAVSPSDLNRIKVPSGGGLFWTVDVDGKPSPCSTLDGIIVHITRRRAMWKSKDATGVPPDCSSNDMMTGVGDPGGNCDKCPLNAFGSAKRDDGSPGRGKACKETKLVFILREGGLLPDIISLPPASLKGMRQWQLALGKPYWSFVSTLTLVADKNKDGVAYARVVPVKLDPLSKEMADSIMSYAQALQGVFAQVTADQVDGDEEV